MLSPENQSKFNLVIIPRKDQLHCTQNLENSPIGHCFEPSEAISIELRENDIPLPNLNAEVSLVNNVISTKNNENFVFVPKLYGFFRY